METQEVTVLGVVVGEDERAGEGFGRAVVRVQVRTIAFNCAAEEGPRDAADEAALEIGVGFGIRRGRGL